MARQFSKAVYYKFCLLFACLKCLACHELNFHLSMSFIIYFSDSQPLPPLLFVVQEYPAFDYPDFSLYFIIFIAFIFQLFPICFHNFFPRKDSRSFLSKGKKACENNLEDLTFDNDKNFSYSALQENIIVLATSVQFSCSVVSDSLQPHELQHARPPCPSPTPRVHSNSCPLSR